MPQVTLQDVIDAGFKAEQFGTPSDWDTADTGYLARLIARAGIWAQGRLGDAAYAALVADTPEAEHVRTAELCWVRGHLWNRRAGFIDSNAVSALESLAYLDRREFEAQAARAFQCAEDNLVLVGAVLPDPAGSAAAMTHVVTGPFARDTAAWPLP